jgi:diguanylate cyclase (GGDEF)-like protein
MPDQHAIGRLNPLLEMLSACARLRDSESLFRVLAERAGPLIDCEHFTVVLCDDHQRIVRSVLIENQIAREDRAIETHPSEASLIRQVLTTGTPSNGITGLCTPMETDGRVVGALCFAARREPFTPQECRFAHFLAEYLAGTFDRLAQGTVILRQTKALSSALDERETALAAAGALSLQMSHLAQHDALTSLPNRLLLNDRLGRAIALASRHGRRMAVLFLDLDRFKSINDSLGHTIGDQVLRSISDRLAASVRSSDTVSRHGGDEFVVLCAELERAEDAAVSAAKIMTAVAAALHIAGHEIHVTGSVGVSIYPDDGDDGDALIRHADTAMYQAKADGGNGYRFFKLDMNARAVERQFVEEGLRRALERHEFVLHYQPKVNLESGVVIGAEALIRWRHPDRGLVPPAQFVSIAEECGLIVPIGQWVLREACRQNRAWQDAGLPRLPVSVNLSAIEFQRQTFLEDVRRILQETRLEARYLELELTESVLMDHSETTIDMLQALKTMGVKLAIDDFGTGYSSLSYLTQLPIDVLKVDQSFVRQLVPDAHGAFKIGPALIVSAVIGMGKSLSHRVVAEGVETREQLAFLQAQRCGEGQGFYFSRPLVPEQFARVLQTGTRH